MFSLRKNTSSSTSPQWDSQNDVSPQAPRFSRLLASASLQPAIDGPPSPENIRAYTEQMKRTSLFTTNNTRSDVSSSASSFYSSSSGNTSRDLSRSSSRRSNASSMPSKGERPESIQIFGKALFSRRTSRKPKASSDSLWSSTALGYNAKLNDSSAKDHYYGMRGGARGASMSDSLSSIEESKSKISKPFNFQHVVHTGREHIPQLSDSESDLAYNFSSIRASQVPAMGHLKGIRAEDLHFENFSSERLDLTPELESDEFERPRTSPAKRHTLKKASLPSPMPRPRLLHAKSHDGLRTAPPPRPPRSPLGMTSPLPPPPRTSSRTSSMVWNNYDPLATTTIERPETVSGFRKPTAFHLPISPPRPITRNFEPEDINVEYSNTPRTAGNDSWPLSAPVAFDSFALADVPEEEEVHVGSRRSRLSTASSLRHSRSVPAFVRLDRDPFEEERPITPTGAGEIGIAISPPKPDLTLTHETWEDDIDYCYEHEAEADCDYDWDRCSFDVPRPNATDLPKSALQRRSIPRSPLVPSNFDLPALSPGAASLASPQPYTPGTTVQPTKRMSHLRSPSHASSFKESHGFHLSPSLLIPGDFAAQMDVSLPPGVELNLEEAEDTLYDELFSSHHSNTEQYHPYHAPQHSDIRHSDAESSPSSAPMSSRSSALSKSASLESVVLLSRAANSALQMRSVSVGSSASLPELVHSRSSHSSNPNADTPRESKISTVAEPKLVVETVKEVPVAPVEEIKAVTPIEGTRSRSVSMSNGPHSRKASGGRKRNASSSANYMLFPQI